MDGPDGADEEGDHGLARTQSLGAESTAGSMASGPRGVAFARSPQQSQSAALCIGEIETELHQNFAAARRPPQYVFAVEATRNGGGGNKSGGEEAGAAIATNRYFQALSEHCDAGSLQYACPPLVLYGPPGVGKSAILSNWLAQQRALREDVGLPQTAPGAAAISSRRMACLARREFVFWHAAGCSRMSCLTTHLLRRVQTELRAFFELKTEVAADDERLRWDLPIFLELAARKGSVLIVIDGVHRMRDEDGGEDLKWLPVTLPPYVRLIVSTTVYGNEAIKAKPVLSPSLQDRDDEGPTSSASLSEEEAAQQANLRSDSILVGSCRDPRRAYTNKALYELKRRGWEMLEVKEMSSAMCQHVLLSFGGAEPVFSLAYTPASTVAAASSPDSSSSSSSFPPSSQPKLRLFPSQYQAILASPATRNPLFLRLLLQALRWSATQHFDLWRLLPLWLEARSAVELYHRVLETWERGQSVSPATRAEALKQAQREGGDHALQWERRQQPRMQPSGSSATSPSQHPPAALDDEAAAAAAAAAAGQSQQQAKDVGADLPLAEIQWRKVHADADKAIEDARAAVEQAAARAMAKGLEAAAGAGPPSDLASSNGTDAVTATATGPQPLVEAEEPTSSGMSDDGSSSDTSASGYVLEPSSSSAISMTPEEGDRASIPQALRGGEEQEGVGDLLGHALAALYVARHGLTVTELVHLLTALREKEDRRICLRLWERREALLAAFDDADAAGEEAVPVAACSSILQRHGIDVKPHDLARLLTASCAWVAGDDRRVRYRALLEHCTSEQQQQQQQQQASSSMDTANGPVRISVPARPQLSDAAGGKNGPPEPRRSTPHLLERETEAALLQMLVALGVLRLHGEDVLVLPLEAEALREAIRVRYIDACGGGLRSAAGEELWHRAIIHYFQSQPSGLHRRCEELPWHLQVCRHWLALRDFLVDLRAFRCMYGGRLKQELFEYWWLLTEGPLVLPGAAAVELGLLDAAPALQDPMEPSAGVTTSPPVFTGQDAPSLSASPPRRRGGRMAPFDIVECYNTSVEEWRESRAKPSVKQVAEVLWLIAKFLAEFADVGKFQVTLPRYLRKPLHPELMEMMALGPPGAGAGAGRAAAAGPDVVVAASDGLPVGINRASFRSKLFLVPATPQDQSASDGDKSEDEDGDDASSTSSVSASKAVRAEGEDGEDEEDEEEERQRREQEEAKALQQSNAALIAHDTTHYYLKRWVWVQFPWLVMANTSLALQLFLGKLEDGTASGPATAAAAFSSSSFSSSSSAPLPGRRFPRSRSTSADGPFRRLWAARKVDPARVACTSAADAHVLHTMVESSMLHIAPHAETAGRLTHTICAEDRLLLSRDSEQEAGPGTATIRIPGGVETTGDDDEGVAHTLLSAPGLPMTLLEKRLAESNQRVAWLRSILDRVVEDRALMAAQLERLERAAAARDQHDRAILEDIKAGELMMEALAQRLRRLQDANTEAAALTAYYKVVIAQCLEKNPVKDTKRVESVERQVALASFQLRSLIHQRDRVAGEQVAFEEEIPKAQTQLEQIQQERVRVKERLALFRRRALPGSSSISSGGSSNSQALMSMLTTTTLFLKGVLPPHSHTPKEQQGTQPAAARGTSPLPSSSSSNGVLHVEPGGGHSGSNSGSSSTSAPPKLTPYQAVFAASRAQRLCAGVERLFELSHVDVNRGQHDDGDGTSRCAPAEAAGKIVHTFKNVQKLNHSLLEECRELEARIAELRGALLAQERKAAASSIDRRLLVETGGGDGESSGAMEQQLPHREPGELEALIQEEEQRCGRFYAMSTTVNEMLDQVKTGINHLARLVAQHSKALPLASLRCNDGQHEDKYDDADVYKVLSTFDERIASIQEIVVLEANEMADGAIKKFATTAAAAAAAAGGKPRDHDGIDMDFLPLLDESSPSQTAASNRRLGVALGGADGKAGAIMDVDPEELVGIDSDVVLFFKGEAYSRERKAHFSYAPPPEESGGSGDGAFTGTWGSTNPLIRPTAKAQGPRALKMAALAGSREQVRVKALASAEQAYEESLRAVRTRDDAMFEALEKEEEQQQVQVESTGETEGLLRSALFLDSPSHLQLRQLLKQEHDVDSRQYPHINEGHGIAITKALEKTEIEVSVRALYGWEEREGKAGRGGAGRGAGAASTSGGIAKLGRGGGEREEGSTRARARQPTSKAKPALPGPALVGKDGARNASKGSK